MEIGGEQQMAREHRRKRSDGGDSWLRIALGDPVALTLVLFGLIGYAVYSLPLMADKASQGAVFLLWDVPLILLCATPSCRPTGPR